MSKIRESLLRIRNVVVKKYPHYRHVFTSEVIDFLTDFFYGLKKAPSAIRRPIAFTLRRIAKKVSRRQDISSELGLLNKFSDVITRAVSVTTKLMLPVTGAHIALKVSGFKAPPSTPMGKVLLAWTLFVRLLYVIELLGAVLTIRDLRSISSDLNSLANEIS